MIITYLFGAGAEGVPGFVWGILIAYFIFFNTFPLNMYFQYAQKGNWNDDLYSYPRGGYIYNLGMPMEKNGTKFSPWYLNLYFCG